MRRVQETREVVEVVEQREEGAVQPAAALLDQLGQRAGSVGLGTLQKERGEGVSQPPSQSNKGIAALTAPTMYLRIHWRCFFATISKQRMRSSARYMFATKGPRSCGGKWQQGCS